MKDFEYSMILCKIDDGVVDNYDHYIKEIRRFRKVARLERIQYRLKEENRHWTPKRLYVKSPEDLLLLKLKYGFGV